MVRVKVRKLLSHGTKYKCYVIALPKEILQEHPKLKKAKFVVLETDLVGNLAIKY